MAEPTAGPGSVKRPERTQDLNVWIQVTTDDVYIRVTDRLGGNPRGDQLWARGFPRPAGRTERECVNAAINALGAGRDGWLDLLGSKEPPLPIEW